MYCVQILGSLLKSLYIFMVDNTLSCYQRSVSCLWAWWPLANIMRC